MCVLSVVKNVSQKCGGMLRIGRKVGCERFHVSISIMLRVGFSGSYD